MTQAVFLKIILGIISALGAFLTGLFFYFLSRLKDQNNALKAQIQKLNEKIDQLKQKYFQDLAGFGKIFAFKSQLQKTQNQLTKRIQRIENTQDHLKSKE